MNHGVVSVYYMTKPRNDIPEDKSDEDIDEDIYDEAINSVPAESEYFCSLSEALKAGLTAYIKNHPAKTLSDFYEAFTRDLEAFSKGTEINNYVFSVCTKTDSSSTYLSFYTEPSFIEVICGGSIYDPNVGSDSYTNWMYSICRSGDEDADQIDITDFDMIYSLFCDPDAEFDIETPDEFFYSSSTDDRDEE